jgi:hypothetical protein
MSRFMLKALTPLLVLLVLVMSVIHALAYDAAYFDGLRAFLQPDHCPAPCFQGIRPGVTTAEEALTILNSSPLVHHVQVGDHVVWWDWDERLAAYVYIHATGVNHPWLTSDTNDVVDRVSVISSVPFVDLWILFGKPDRGYIDGVYNQVSGISFAAVTHVAAYDAPHLELQMALTCPVRDFWSVPARMVWWAKVPDDYGEYDIPKRLTEGNWWGC